MAYYCTAAYNAFTADVIYACWLIFRLCCVPLFARKSDIEISITYQNLVDQYAATLSCAVTIDDDEINSKSAPDLAIEVIKTTKLIVADETEATKRNVTARCGIAMFRQMGRRTFDSDVHGL